jgi:hypothetical protein
MRYIVVLVLLCGCSSVDGTSASIGTAVGAGVVSSGLESVETDAKRK